ncbi:MAG: Bor family protein [Ignavibacteria bacterium]|nr:Bor family protein [Ignavibacteria bacterium]
MSIRIIATFFIGIFLLTGCYTLNQIGEPVDQGIEITNMEKVTPVSHFETDATINHFLWGLVSPSNAEVEQLIAQEVKRIGGTRAVNIRMKYQMTFVNGLLNFITLGIYNPFTLTVEGDVVK